MLHSPCLEHLADRRDPGGADPRARADLGRTFQSSRITGDELAQKTIRGGNSSRMRARKSSAAASVLSSRTACSSCRLLELAVKARTGPAQWFAEFVATFGLIVTILAVSRFKSEAIPVAVGLYITAAYWFTASTSFANPAVTIARALTNSFSGIAPADVPMFIVAQLIGALAGARRHELVFARRLFPSI
jgi:glycerol uptake facilitator-like aquaporin